MSTDTTVAIQPVEAALSLADPSRFEHIQRVATMFSKSQLAPVAFQNNLPNCIIALEMAQRINASPLMLMQNLHIIHGKPSFGSSFLIASVNASRRFTPLRFEYEGEKGTKDRGCTAVARSMQDNAECRGITVTMEIADKEGWLSKSGSKWKTMPDLMLMYRAATWWTRMYAPEQTMGFQTQEEAYDIDPAIVTEVKTDPKPDIAAPVKRTRNVRAKGFNAAKQVSESETEATDVPATETPAPAPVAEEPKAEAAPAADTDKQPSPADDLEPTAQRCEVVSMKETQAKKKGGAIGPVTEVVLSGEFAGSAFYDGPSSDVPGNGSVVDVKIEAREHRGATMYIIHSIVAVG